MLEPITFLFSLLAVLVAYLFFSFELRWRAGERRRRSRASQSPGKAFDVSVIAPQIRRVRQDPVAALQTRRHYTYYRAGLILAAQRMISGFSFFHRERSDHETEHRNA